MKYRWLHISDLHSLCMGIKTRIFRDALIQEIEYLNRQMRFSFVLITGDISDKNMGYQEAKKFIHSIAETLVLPLEKIFIVPGNHDMDRENPTNREEIVHRCWELELLDGSEDEYVKYLIPGQQNFFEAYEDILGRKYPKNKLHYYQDFDENLSIIHLNTSWMCFDSKNESGKLHIGLNALYDCLSGDCVSSKAIKIAIGHHRLSDFNTITESHIKRIFQSKDIDLYLGGHCHESSVIYDPEINTEICSCRQARAEESTYPAGFIVGDINTDTDQSSFQFYSWHSKFAKWTYDYTVNSAKHGKYYLHGSKFTVEPIVNRNTIVDLKLFGFPLDYDEIMEIFGLKNSVIYKSSIRDIRPSSSEDWAECLRDLKNIYETVVKNAYGSVNIFPIALIPLLVSFGYLMQNNNQNVKIYQYYENQQKWVYDECDDNISIKIELERRGNKKLAFSLNISGEVKREDINQSLGLDYDLLSIGIDNPIPSVLNYREDVLRVKLAAKNELDKINGDYDEIHLFLAAPAGLCIEIGRIIRENMYPNTYIYNYVRSEEIKYTKVFNLMNIRGTE